MEYTLKAFTEELQRLFTSSNLFPYSPEVYIDKDGNTQPYSKKHPKRNPLHMKTEVEDCLKYTMVESENIISFDMGNENLELNYPHYHILENTPYIRKAHMGTTKSKGSQAYIEDRAKRDYELVYFNGKTFVKEYSKNVRGARNRIGKVSHWEGGEFVNRDSNSYLNKHYQYIEKILEQITVVIANEFGMSLGRVKSTGLVEEFAEQQGTSVDNIMEIFDSFIE